MTLEQWQKDAHYEMGPANYEPFWPDEYDGIAERAERLGIDNPQTEEEWAAHRRMFHLHDKPEDCDEPEIHFGGQQ